MFHEIENFAAEDNEMVRKKCMHVDQKMKTLPPWHREERMKNNTYGKPLNSWTMKSLIGVYTGIL